jgi:hypothetical protein
MSNATFTCHTATSAKTRRERAKLSTPMIASGVSIQCHDITHLCSQGTIHDLALQTNGKQINVMINLHKKYQEPKIEASSSQLAKCCQWSTGASAGWTVERAGLLHLLLFSRNWAHTPPSGVEVALHRSMM